MASSQAWGGAGGTLQYGPLGGGSSLEGPTAIPILGGIGLVLLAALLLLAFWRLQRNGVIQDGRLMMIALICGALASGLGGVKLVSDVVAQAGLFRNMDSSSGGVLSFEPSESACVLNATLVPLQVLAMDGVSGLTQAEQDCGPVQQGVDGSHPPCKPGLVVVPEAACGATTATVISPPGEIDLNLDYRALSLLERTNLTGLDDTERAALNLWKTQVLANGTNNGGIYFNVIDNPQDFREAEVQLSRDLYDEDRATFGGVNGKTLDQHFFAVALKTTGQDFDTLYGNVPGEFADGPIILNNVLTGANGLGSFNNGVIRLWTHDLLDNGAMDGSITKFTLLSPYALDKVDGSPGSLDLEVVKILLAADLASGTPDGTPLRLAFRKVLDAIYLDGPDSSIAEVLSTAGIDQATAETIFDDWAESSGYEP